MKRHLSCEKCVRGFSEQTEARRHWVRLGDMGGGPRHWRGQSPEAPSLPGLRDQTRSVSSRGKGLPFIASPHQGEDPSLILSLFHFVITSLLIK